MKYKIIRYTLNVGEQVEKEMKQQLDKGGEVEISNVAILRKTKVKGPLKGYRLIARKVV